MNGWFLYGFSCRDMLHQSHGILCVWDFWQTVFVAPMWFYDRYLYFSRWWFQPNWKILVKLDHFPGYGWNKKDLKPPPSFYMYIFHVKHSFTRSMYQCYIAMLACKKRRYPIIYRFSLLSATESADPFTNLQSPAHVFGNQKKTHIKTNNIPPKQKFTKKLVVVPNYSCQLGIS